MTYPAHFVKRNQNLSFMFCGAAITHGSFGKQLVRGSCINPGGSSSCADWFDLMVRNLSDEALKRFLILCWWCWHIRNELCFKNKRVSPEEEIAGAEIVMNTWFLAEQSSNHVLPGSGLGGQNCLDSTGRRSSKNKYRCIDFP